MKENFLLEPKFDAATYEMMAFLMSLTLSELMKAKKASTKEAYEELQRKLRREIGQLGVNSSDFFLYACMPTHEEFPQLTLCYYQGRLAK